jgi:hypothetical protein
MGHPNFKIIRVLFNKHAPEDGYATINQYQNVNTRLFD